MPSPLVGDHFYAEPVVYAIQYGCTQSNGLDVLYPLARWKER